MHQYDKTHGLISIWPENGYRTNRGGRETHSRNPNNCFARMFSNYSAYQCSNKGKIELNGERFCGVHCPDKAKARRDKARAEDIERTRVAEIKRTHRLFEVASAPLIEAIAAGLNNAREAASELVKTRNERLAELEKS